MNEINIGDKVRIKNKEYITCKIDGLYYFVNLNSGRLWTDGLNYEHAIIQSNIHDFQSIK